MKLRRRTLNEIKGDKRKQKACSMAIWLKYVLKTSRIHHYTTNKLAKATGISHKTAKTYEKLLIKFGFIHFEGSEKNPVMIVNNLYSHTTDRNICIDEMDLSSFFSVYRSLQSFLFMRIQHNKDFIRRLLQSRYKPETPKEFRAAKRKVKDLVYQGRLKSANVKYREYGLSLQRIAKEIGCCVRTAQRVTNFAVSKEWVNKKHIFKWVISPFVYYRQVDGYTFTTMHHLCLVKANRYYLSDSISQAMSHGMVWY